jgi:hypothetical protein
VRACAALLFVHAPHAPVGVKFLVLPVRWLRALLAPGGQALVGVAARQCPRPHLNPEAMAPAAADAALRWAQRELQCRAGRREVQLDRYVITSVRDGGEFRRELDAFLEQARAHRKTGLLALVEGAAATAGTVREEIGHLANVVHAAGLVSTPGAALAGCEIRLPLRTPCPVTGRDATYSFFPVCFCRNADRVEDELYDVSLSCPWTAINTTSDAFAFALLIRDRAREQFGREPFEIENPQQCRALFERAVLVWQKMSIGTIEAYSRRSVVAQRAVALSADQCHWIAAHQDPGFAELSKERFAHEMPVLYARALISKWFAVLHAGEAFEVEREGQAGGRRINDEAVALQEVYR